MPTSPFRAYRSMSGSERGRSRQQAIAIPRPLVTIPSHADAPAPYVSSAVRLSPTSDQGWSGPLGGFKEDDTSPGVCCAFMETHL